MYNIQNVVFGEGDDIRGISSEVLWGYVRMNKSLIKINPYPSFSYSFDLALFILK